MLKHTLLSMVVVMCLVAVPRPAHAGCGGKFQECLVAAAKTDSYWSFWWAYCDCELDLAECLRVAVIGV